MAKKVVLAGACRTAIGTMGGALSTTPAPELGAIVIKEALNRAGVPADQVDHVYMGCVIQAGQAQMIQAGDADIVVAGGMENMSMAPFALPNGRYGYRMTWPSQSQGALVDTMVKDALWDAFNDYHMITTADNICEQWGLTREELDEFAANSQAKAAKARAEGLFKREIVPVEIKKKKETVIFDTDEGPRDGITAEKLGTMRPINKDGFVTAGNASGINDGAAAIVVMSEEKAKELGVKPMATFVAGALAGVAPEIMGIGPVAATKKVMAKADYKIEDFDVIEANEAFAAQSVAVGKDLGIDVDRQLNPRGGAIALGHPVGASGCRILVTLLHEMEDMDAKKGLATLCIGGGMGCATIVERD